MPRNKVRTKTTNIGLMNAAFRGVNKWLVALGIYFVTLVALIKKWAAVKNALQAQLPPSWRSYWLAPALLPFAVALTFQVCVAARRWKKEKQLAIRGVNYRDEGEVAEDDYFSISPILRKHPDNFKRADQAHAKALNWLRDSAETVVYLTSVSGAGKSSLLHAFVLPKLESSTPAFKCVVLRSFHDPTQTIRTDLLTPGAIWKKSPPKVEELRSLVEQACAHVNPRRLLFVFDQFEEFLIIHERDQLRAKEFIELLSSVQSDPIGNLRILFVLRSDYVGLLQPLNDAGVLPSVHFGTNAMSVSAFREVDARDFLIRSPLEIQPGLMNEIFGQMHEIEPDAGLFRPITLNMMGLFLERRAIKEKRPLVSLRENFLEDHLAQCIRREDVREHAPAVLKRMITRRGTNRAKSVSELSAETGISEEAVTGCLVNLRDQGIVRCVDQRAKVWEISHDLVAQLLNNILHSRWHFSTPFVFLSALALPIIAAGYLLFLSNLHHTERNDEEQTEGSQSMPADTHVMTASEQDDFRKGRAFGIDAAQSDIVDWKQLKEHGVVFAFVRATQGISFNDPAFRKNWSAMREAGIIRGAYHQMSGGNAELQAKTFADHVGPLMADDLPPAVCFEPAVSGPDPTIQDLDIFIGETQKLLGRRPIIYGGSLLRDAVKQASGPSALFACPLWIVRYRESPLALPNGWSKWTFWQFSDGQVGPTDPIREVFLGDTNLFNGSEADLRKFIAESKL